MLHQSLGNAKPPCTAKWACLEAHLPGQCPTRVGIILLEPSADRLHLRIKPDWWKDLADAEDRQIWDSLSEDLQGKAEELGGTTFLDWLDDCCSHSLRIGVIQHIEISQPETSVGSLYREHVEPLGIALAGRKASAHGPIVLTSAPPRPSVRRTPQHVFSTSYRWTAQAALAASMLVAGWIAGYHSSRQRQPEPNITFVANARELPLASEFHYQHVQLNLSSDARPSRRRTRRRKTRGSAHVPRPFRLAHPPMKRHEVQVATIQPLLLPATYMPSGESVPSHLTSEPELPEYHPRHKRFVRVLATIAMPFRFIASR